MAQKKTALAKMRPFEKFNEFLHLEGVDVEDLSGTVVAAGRAGNVTWLGASAFGAGLEFRGTPAVGATAHAFAAFGRSCFWCSHGLGCLDGSEILEMPKFGAFFIGCRLASTCRVRTRHRFHQMKKVYSRCCRPRYRRVLQRRR